MSDARDSDPARDTDLIEVRSDERFDEVRVAEYLRPRLPDAEGAMSVSQFGGGFANLTYLLRFGEGETAREFVLRRPPLGPVAKGAHDMKREYRTLSVLWRAFEPAPRAYLLCEDPDLLGADFFVMERRPGVVIRREMPERFGGGRDPVANRQVSQVVIDTLAQFHDVDAAGIGLQDLGRPEGFLERQVRGWSGRYEAARTAELPVAEELSRWLETERPMSPPPTLLHNDWKLDNMAVAEDDPGRCAAVYDWDMCTLGDPLCDVGTLMCSWLEAGEVGHGPASMPSAAEGFMTRAEALSRYAERRGVDLSVMPYYQVFGTFKMAVVLQQIYYRYAQGQTQDPRFAGMEALARGLFDRAASLRP